MGDGRSRNIFNLSLKVHQFIKCNQSKKENKKEKNVQMVRPIKWDKQREKNNKFVQEMESEQITQNDEKKEENGSMDDLFQMLITKGMNKEKTEKFIKYLTANEYDSDSIIFDIENQERMNDLSQSNIYQALDLKIESN